MKFSNKKGFTLVELLVVISLIVVFSSIMTTIWVNSFVQWNIANKLTYSKIDNSMNSSLRNAMSWYWGKSIDIWVKDSKTLLPEDFMLFFRSSLENDNISWFYSVIETQNRRNWNLKYTRIINKEDKELSSSYIYLKEIRAKTDEGDVWIIAQSFGISFRNPTGKVSFYIDNDFFIEDWIVILSEDSTNTINEWLTPVENSLYNIVELDFYWNDSQKKFTYKIYRDKQFYVSLD